MSTDDDKAPRIGWSGLMRDELGRLPETAANIREASENLKRVSEELVTVSAVLSKVVATMEATGMIDGLARVEQIGREVDAVRAAVISGGPIGEAVSSLERVLGGISDGARRAMGFATGTEDRGDRRE
ncbi:MAG TPA: hypothetical protein VGA13_03120 [Acidimicrobiales bacterium]|jgi:hypothetical protein